MGFNLGNIMTPDKEKDEVAVKKWVETYLALARSGEVEEWYKLWADDVVLLPPNMKPLHGIDELKALIGPGFGRANIEHETFYTEVKTDTTMAYASYGGIEKSTPKEGGKTIVKENKCIWILRREPDSSWKATHCIWSPNQPPDDDPSYAYEV